MGFRDLLERKLGPMSDLLQKPARTPDAGVPEPKSLYYRRAAGLEIEVHPKVSWAEVQIGRTDAGSKRRLTLEDATVVAGLTSWRHASSLAEEGVSADRLWRLVEADLLFFAREEPDVLLTGVANVAKDGVRIARRASAWPTLAVETAVQIAPMPFMPRDRDLAGAHAAGFRFASLERGHEVFGLTIIGDEEIGAVLRRLVPRLDGRSTADEIVESFPKNRRNAAKKLLDVLDRMTILEPIPERDEPFAAPSAPAVTWLGHAGVLFQTPTTNLLFDPLFFSVSEPPERYLSGPKFDPRLLPRIDGVVLTHPDNDHLNPNSLSMIRPNVPIVVPRTGHQPAPYQVDTLGILRVLGFDNVNELEPWSSLMLGDVKITGCPFVGESWDLDLATLTYFAEAEGASIFLSADSAEMPNVYDELKGKVDVAFMGVSGCAEAMVMPRDLGYGNFYADWVPPARRNEFVRHCAGPKEAAASVARLEPRYAFGYAAGGASYVRTAYSDMGDHDELARLLEAQSGPTKPVALEIGERVLVSELGDLPPFSRSC